MKKEMYMKGFTSDFQNTSERGMSLETVFKRIHHFMSLDPRAEYKLMFGTDSQVHSHYTLFITGIVIQRMGKGCWACYRKISIPRRIESLREKISTEVGYSQEIASYFDIEKQNELIEIIFDYIEQGSGFKMECHLDIGKEKKNLTNKLVKDMVSQIESMGIEAKIKPDSFVASSYADRHTK